LKKLAKSLEKVFKGFVNPQGILVFANEPAVIRTIDREIGDFEEHLRILGEKMPRFERKLETAKELPSRTRQELTFQINRSQSTLRNA
jgi:hypothetical protein